MRFVIKGECTVECIYNQIRICIKNQKRIIYLESKRDLYLESKKDLYLESNIIKRGFVLRFKKGLKRIIYLESSESDCRSRGREFDPRPVPYFCGDLS